MLNDMYSLVESVVASALAVWGLAILTNKHIISAFFKTFTNIEKNETLNGLTAGMFLILGLIVIWVHNDWYFSAALIVTVLGWILTIKASLWLLFPRLLSRLAKRLSPLVLNFWFRIASGLLSLILALAIFWKNYIADLIL